ncbi:TetR/AcrR family transcriptional regulator [Winogradskya consettensis]|uniref:TetR family transcriptional regulator n=1 Tax=Winogradskya consettensis TaxID=113560 RepID=A0A919VSC6_9ACTN|nr:TetR family transcriptional regulator [Actinoplanes consettensis]GIM73705.1 TetR family transcriptional regulator [Actinoplanes consettensis]
MGTAPGPVMPVAPGRATIPGTRRPRDAERTRAQLLAVATGRFARNGYATTTVRDIADDAGVNVALISRYFTSKEGLFEACLAEAVTEVRRDSDDTPLDRIAAALAHKIAGPDREDRLPERFLLLLRSSGDQHAEDMRLGVLRTISERMASAAAGHDDGSALLRAQIVLSAALGIILMRGSLGLQPLAGATEQDLAAPLADLVNALCAKDRTS